MLPHLDDYVISFVVLCVFWLAHLRLLARLRDVDTAFVWLNLAFLLFTTFVPTLTALIGNNPEQPVAAIVYGCNLLLILLCEALMWRHASRHHFNDSVLDAPGVWQFMRNRFLFAAAVIVAGVTCALLEIAFATGVDYASYVYLLLIVAGLVRRDGTAKARRRPHGTSRREARLARGPEPAPRAAANAAAVSACRAACPSCRAASSACRPSRPSSSSSASARTG